MKQAMVYKNPEVIKAAAQLKIRFKKIEEKKAIRRTPELTALYARLKTIPAGERAEFGKEVNGLKKEIDQWIAKSTNQQDINHTPIDVTAPFDINAPLPRLLPVTDSSLHPLTSEIAKVLDIFARMGFGVVTSREIDDDYHMFGSLNFPPDHPARDDYDSFVTSEGLIAPAHTSTMQNRVLKAYKKNLESGEGIRVVIPGRVFRNEDLDASHEHTFYQLEGVYVDRGVNVSNLIATLKVFLEEYWGQSLEVRTQPFYFPFTEPSFEFVVSCPFCQKSGCQTCGWSGWIELLGCGMIHPNVLAEAKIDAGKYSGFAWGGGIDRLVMMKYGIEDVRYFHSGNLEFLRQFK